MIRSAASSIDSDAAIGACSAACARIRREREALAMSERDTLLSWLDRAAARTRHGFWLRDASALACALLALLALHHWLPVAIPAPAVRAALAPFFLFAAAGAIAIFGMRMARRPTLEQAAGAADARAGLRDELRSALWFVQRSADDPLVDLLLARAARTARALDVRKLFPLAIPRHLLAALALVLLAVVSARLVPGVDLPENSRASVAAAPAAAANAVTIGQPQASLPAQQDEAVSESDRTQAAWSQLQALVAQLGGDEEVGQIEQAVAARDAARAQRLLQAMRQRQTGEAPGGTAARPEGEQMSAALAAGILERLKDLLQAEAAQPDPGSGAAEAPTANLTEQLRADDPPEPGDPRGQQSAGESMLNEMLRAINRSSIGERQVAGGAGEAAEEGTRGGVGGGAMGRRIGVSQGGAQEGDRPDGTPTGDAESAPVLGQKTERLEAQLQRVAVESSAGEQSEPADEEALYAQTRAQSARLGYASATAQPKQGSEAVIVGQNTPLAYRDAVKRYMLEQHEREASAPGAGEPVRPTP
jgi:hypothetical protein